ncbi:ATP-binding protein [Kribbella shirazensis]|uniref:DNA-binding CsgD family transcriptional regulator n=1 Tax=Kribbella shirazensis TaxID=1105143 RepID=A0A7X5VDS3_9ACTN|nr:LuxR family transcriptional regulator [Kribbella shirazensis]NIK58921.1 DNA-binding CsgD family transcriptional regulator [Kribbella shirazensis]
MTSSGPELRGRRAECARLDHVVGGVRSGEGQVLIVRGEAGIGKSALLEYLAGTADGCRVARAAGVESEMELPFAGLHQLCLPLLRLTDRLPAPQRAALEVAFGLSGGGPPDRFLIGAATLSLLSAASDREPLLCVVDDAQWLDLASIQALSFVGRRLFADRIGLVFAVREPVTCPDWSGFPELPIGGLADEYAGALLDSVVPGRLDGPVRARIVAETRGNPLALMELPRGLTAAQLAGGFERPDARPLASQIEQNFARRVDALPPDTRRLLLTAAAEPVGDVPLLMRALTILGVPMSTAAPAEAAGLIDIAGRVRFRHPLVRSATYRAADPVDRRAVHRALAEAIDPELDPDRRAWHRAQGVDGPDEDVAAELERSADRAQRRGGMAASSAFLQRATELTPEPATRSLRALSAAQASLAAGAFETALRLLSTAEQGTVDELHQARVNLMRAQLTFASGHNLEAPPLLLEAARRLEPLDLGLARDTYMNALASALFAGRFGQDRGIAYIARAAKTVPRLEEPRKHDVLYDAVTRLFADGPASAVVPARETMRAFSTGPDEDMPWLWQAAALAVHLWDEENWDHLTARLERIARDAGNLNELPLVLHHRAVLLTLAGEFSTVAAMLAEVKTISDATGVGLGPYGDIFLAAWRGRREHAQPMIAGSLEDSISRGEGGAVSNAHLTSAILLNGLAQYPAALESALAATAYPDEHGVANLALAEVIEAAARAGRPESAVEAYERLRAVAEPNGTSWGLGVLARATGLRSQGPAAEAAYQDGIERLSRTRMRMDLARTHLVYGEWLRREGRRQDARVQLRTAYKLFSVAGAGAFSERAARELAATGEVLDERRTADPSGRDALTAQEARIADLAGAGLTNAEIGAQMFLSQHTVEWHLRKVFAKLGITSRKQLRP